MTPVIVKYPLDPTGRNPNNLVQGEIHTMVRRKVRAIATIYGAFFTESLKIVDTATNLELVRGTQYYATEMYEKPTEKFGKEVCAIILITDETVSDTVSIQYQAVGGEFSTSMTAITQLLDNLALDDRPLEFAAIIDKPSEYPPAHHLHDAGDLYGLEYVVNALDRVRRAVEMGDRLSHDAIYRYIDSVLGSVSTEVLQQIRTSIADGLASHLAASNPHTQYLLKTEAAQLTVAAVRTPNAVSPADGTVDVLPDVTFSAGAYYSLYNLAMKAAQFQLSQNPDCSAPYVFDSVQGPVTSYHFAQLLASNTQYYWRVRYQDSDNVWSSWSVVNGFKTAIAGIATPSITSPAAGVEVITNGITLQSTAFTTIGGIADALAAIEWEIWTGPNGTGTRVFNTSAAATGGAPAGYGEQLFDTPGTYQWTCPAGVTSVSAIAIGGGGAGGGGATTTDANGNSPGGGGGGGGGLGWKNNIPVVPGQTYTVVVGDGGIAGVRGVAGGNGGDSYFISPTTVKGGGGTGGMYSAKNTTQGTSGAGGTYVGDGGGNGGAGGYFYNNVNGGSGGGAGGYAGSGGSAASATSATAGTGGGAGAGATPPSDNGAGGGGTGIYGQGTSGAVLTGTTYTGQSGSNGTIGGGVSNNVAGAGGRYGGGGGGANGSGNAGKAAPGGVGAVRLVWGTSRTFPSTNVTQTSAAGTTAPATNASVAPNVLENHATYYPRVRHTGAKLGASAWSSDQTFSLNYPPLPTVIGESFGGGYYGGDITYGGKTYVIIVAPKATGETTLALNSSSSSSSNYTGNDSDSVTNTTNLKALGTSAAANFVKALTIGGYTDWQIPSQMALQVISTNLRAGLATAPAAYKTGGTEAFSNSYYWSSSPYVHTEDESYYDPDVPTYSWVNHMQSYSNVYMGWNSDVGSTPAVSCPSGQTISQVSYGYFFTLNPNKPTAEYPGGSPDDRVYASYVCSWQAYEQTGTTSGAYHQVYTTYYDARTYYINGQANGYSSKTTARPLRAIRLLPK